MKPEYRREIQLLCPTCGCCQFEYETATVTAKCASCGREITRDELERENSENINAHLNEMESEVFQDIQKDLRNSFQEAFSGSKHVKLKMK